ncbi:MAG: hypothetical protein AB1449_01610 [Chloroflexota bacterium]
MPPPGRVPALIGPGALGRFQDGAQLQTFVRAAMPFQAPGSLPPESYWQVVAFILQENGAAGTPQELGPENAAAVILQPASTNLATGPTPSTSPQDVGLVTLGILVLTLAGLGWLFRVGGRGG